jgi:hypothetical protein
MCVDRHARTMSRLRPLPAVLSERPFSTAAAHTAGIGSARLGRSDLRHPVHGVHTTRDVDLVVALSLVLLPHQHISHVTALRLWGAPLPRRAQSDRPAHVTTLGDAALMRRPSVVAHRSGVATGVVERHGTRMSDPARAWYESRTLLTVDELVVVAEHLVGRAALATVDDLASWVRPGDRGVARSRMALDLVRVGSESAMETTTRLIAVRAGFPEPELNVDVRDARGRFLGRVDMAWPELRIAVEYDGDHHRDQGTFRRDQWRGNGFTVNGWIVIHVTAVDIPDPAQFVRRLRDAFDTRTGRR